MRFQWISSRCQLYYSMSIVHTYSTLRRIIIRSIPPTCSQLKRLTQFLLFDHFTTKIKTQITQKKRLCTNKNTSRQTIVFCTTALDRHTKPNWKFTIHEVRHSCWLPLFLHIGLHFECENDYAMQCNFISLFLFLFLCYCTIRWFHILLLLVSSVWTREFARHMTSLQIQSILIESTFYSVFSSSSSISWPQLTMQVNHLRIVIIFNLYLFTPIFLFGFNCYGFCNAMFNVTYDNLWAALFRCVSFRSPKNAHFSSML